MKYIKHFSKSIRDYESNKKCTNNIKRQFTGKKIQVDPKENVKYTRNKRKFKLKLEKLKIIKLEKLDILSPSFICAMSLIFPQAGHIISWQSFGETGTLLHCWYKCVATCLFRKVAKTSPIRNTSFTVWLWYSLHQETLRCVFPPMTLGRSVTSGSKALWLQRQVKKQ